MSIEQGVIVGGAAGPRDAAPWQSSPADRLAQMLTVLVVAIGASIVVRLVSDPLARLPWLQGLTLVMLGVAFELLKRGAREAAAAIMLSCLTAMLLSLVVLNEGLRDEAMMGLPGVLVVAALLGNRRQMLILLAVMLAVVTGLGLANVQGWYVNAVRPTRLSTIVDLCTILAVTAFCAGLLARDLALALESLRRENEAVLRTREQVEYLATHDALTGLPNRPVVRDRFEQAAVAARRSGGKVALLSLDLDHFKNVNDSLGHPAGDSLLRTLGERLRKQLRTADTVSRAGGDEFLILLGSVPDGDAVAEVAGKLLAVAAEPQTIGGVEVRVGASMGIAICPDDGEGFDGLLKKADIAMYRAKEGGRENFRFFDVAMNDSVTEHLMLVNGMRRALERGEFVLHYQPQFDLADGRIVGVEALLRWQHPQKGRISPARFIPVAEQSGQIVEIGAWVLHEACRQARAWQSKGLPELVVSVNLSPVQVRRGVLERDIMRALQASGLPPALLELEFTESLLIEDNDALREMLARLRAHGVRFSIDDFGTGYSNLAYLKRFEFERLKIDQSFIRRLVSSPEDDAIVRAIVQMADALQLGVIAEGIEDRATLERLREIGCSEGQGFHWAPGLPARDFEAFALSRRASPSVSGSAREPASSHS